MSDLCSQMTAITDCLGTMLIGALLSSYTLSLVMDLVFNEVGALYFVGASINYIQQNAVYIRVWVTYSGEILCKLVHLKEC